MTIRQEKKVLEFVIATCIILLASLFTHAQTIVPDQLVVRTDVKPAIVIQNPFSEIVSALYANDKTNLYVGVEAGENSTLGGGEMGRYQTCVGYQSCKGTAPYLNFRNTGIGAQTLMSVTIGNQNTAISPFAGMRLTEGTKNIFNGVEAGSHCTTCNNNVFEGVSAGRLATTTSDSVIIGMNAGYEGNGNANTFGGQGAMGYSTGSWNAFWGNNAGGFRGGDENSGVGWLVAVEQHQGNRNSFFGSQAGRFRTYGNDSTFIGAGVWGTDGDNQLVISNLIFSDNANGRGYDISTGGVGIGTRTPQDRLDVNGGTIVRGNLQVCDAQGCVTLTAENLRRLLALLQP